MGFQPTVIEGDKGKHAAAQPVRKALTSLEQQIATAQERFSFAPQDVSKLVTDIEASPQLMEVAPEVRGQTILAAFQRAAGEASKVEGQPNVVKLHPKTEVTLKEILEALPGIVEKHAQHLGKSDPERLDVLRSNVKEFAKREAEKAAAKGKAVGQGQGWKHLATEHKVNAGMWGIAALMGAFSLMDSATHAITKDDDGKAHVQWSQVGMTLLQATLTAGCAYLGVQAVRGRHVL